MSLIPAMSNTAATRAERIGRLELGASDSDMNRETDKRADRAHPVLDHSKAVRVAADRLQLTSPEIEWKGWATPHRFSCEQGHSFQKSPLSLIRARAAVICPECVAQAHLLKVHVLASKANIVCLDHCWRGYGASYAFRCSQGHTWRRRLGNMQSNPGCPVCVRQRIRAQRQRSDGLERLRKTACAHGGKCLSSIYVGMAGRYAFRCAQDHEWSAAAGDVLYKGQWCRLCADQRKRERYRLADGLERLQTLAKAQGGQCLTSTYTGMAAKYLFRCIEGHEWRSIGKRISRGFWCPQCELASRRGRGQLSDGLRRLQEAASLKGGICLSSDYTGTAGKYRFRCRVGHEWEAFGSAIRRGTWCQQCAHEERRLGLEMARQVAVERGGECLSQAYVNRKSKLQWRCHRGHCWQTSMNSIQAGHWCPTCAHQAQIKSRTSKARKRYRNGVETVGHLPSVRLEEAL